MPVSCDTVQGHVMQQPELADFEPTIETRSSFSSDCLFLLLEQAIKCAKPSPQDEFAKSKKESLYFGLLFEKQKRKACLQDKKSRARRARESMSIAFSLETTRQQREPNFK